MNVAKIPRRRRDEGQLETRTWQDKDSKDRHTTEIIANEMKMLGSRSGQGDAPGRQRNGP